MQKKNVCRRLEEWTEADTPTSRPEGRRSRGRKPEGEQAEARAEASSRRGEEPGAKAKGERSSGAESPSRDRGYWWKVRYLTRIRLGDRIGSVPKKERD